MIAKRPPLPGAPPRAPGEAARARCAIASIAALAGATAAAAPPLGFKLPIERSGDAFAVDPLASIAPPPSLERLFSIAWRTPLAEFDPALFRPRETAGLAYDRNMQVLFAGARDGRVHAVDVDGVELWEFDAGAPFNGGPALDRDRVFAATAGGLLFALDAGSGQELWRYDAKEELMTAPVVAGDLVYAVSGADALFAVGAADGKWRWQHRRDSPSALTVRGAARPAVRGGRLVAGFSDGTAVGFDAKDGTVSWTARLSPATRTQLYDVDADFVFDDDGAVFGASYSDGVFRLRADTGQVEWQTAVSGAAALALRGSSLYVGAAGHVYALDAGNGRIAWDVAIGGLAAAKLLLVGRHLVAATAGPILFLDAATGRLRRAFNPGRGVSAPPLYAEGTLYVLSNVGHLYALDLPGASR